MSELSDSLRARFTKGNAAKNAGLTDPEDIVSLDDVVYGEDAEWQALDIYRPKAAGDSPLPVIVNVHGGGWVHGRKEGYRFYCMSLAQRGFAVVNFTYRLAPEHRHPASLEDTNSVFAWVLANGARYGLDTGRVFAMGDSAGGHLLSLFAAMCTDPEYAKLYSFAPPEGFAPRAIALNCGAYNIATSGGPQGMEDLTRRLMWDFLPGEVTGEALERINVLNHITPRFPPAFVMTCTGDFLQNQALPLAERLTRSGVPHVCRFYAERDRLLPHVFNTNIKLQAAKVCGDEECAFFREFC